MNPPNKITFFSRFEADILSGKKTITLRDESESFYQAGQRVSVSNLEDGRCYGELDILSVEEVAFDELNDTHAKQENMSLEELKILIRQIYPGITSMYMIRFSLA
ncbi:protein of unknown function DUF437 [Shewanella halifaxensis HAW-EB4]|uniref:N(4)-acetylcytidine amidohydrolase n=1 Tax=Shewanella halifaxensis (strain HAW-EB4) TaxID=458817 RepID=B0TP35_SHEHH|nr:N(4)-acetylcytidine aminohydrolase [Shewanella halifaxensis]ABZ76192.1 protein of unknown function DUF437 [Shewanella halifaxensis HAW-EB4]